MSSFIPHETVICDDRDPSLINTWMKYLINDKEMFFKKYPSSGKNSKVFENC